MDERELALAVAAEAPAPDPDFARQLDERVRLGFPRDGRATRLTLAWARATAAARKRPPLALAGAVASMLIALAVAIPLIGGESGTDQPGVLAPMDSPTSQGRAGGGAAETLDNRLATEPAIVQPNPAGAARRIEGGSSRVAPAPPISRPGFAPGTRDRRIERSATLTLAAPDDRLNRVAADIATVTDRHRGFVLSSSLATGDEGVTTGGQFELRIPAARLDTALADLAKLGQVRSRTIAGEDVTAAFVTAGDRLEAARAERVSLLTRLESADGDNAAASLRLRLDANAHEINRLRGQIAGLRVRTDYADVAVTLRSTDAESAAAPAGAEDGLGGALDDAASSLSGALELLIRALGVAIPPALVAAGIALATRAIQHRRRESTLTGS